MRQGSKHEQARFLDPVQVKRQQVKWFVWQYIIGPSNPLYNVHVREMLVLARWMHPCLILVITDMSLLRKKIQCNLTIFRHVWLHYDVLQMRVSYRCRRLPSIYLKHEGAHNSKTTVWVALPFPIIYMHELENDA